MYIKDLQIMNCTVLFIHRDGFVKMAVILVWILYAVLDFHPVSNKNSSSIH